jgi:hypothetical protein
MKNRLSYVTRAIVSFPMLLGRPMAVPVLLLLLAPAGCGSDPSEAALHPTIEEQGENKNRDEAGREKDTGQTDETVDPPMPGVPRFRVGSDQRVDENAGPQTVTGWATEISSGAGEATDLEVFFTIIENTNEPLFSAQPAVSSEGTLFYTPAPNANGRADLKLMLSNEDGATSAAQSFAIMVIPVNDAPIAFSQNVTAESHIPKTIILEGFDADGDELTFYLGGHPEYGTIELLPIGGPTTAAVLYTPLDDGDYKTSFTFYVDDGKAYSAPATIDVEVISPSSIWTAL